MTHLKFKVHKLVSNLPNVADNQDIDLVNSWGILIDDETLWVSDNGTGLITNYDLNGLKLPTSIIIPPVNGDQGAPTGIVVNNTRGFVITAVGKKAASFLIVATENGTIDGYNPLVDPVNAIIAVNNSGLNSVYKGLAIAGNYLYAADFFNNKIDSFDFNFTPVLTFPFLDPSIINPIPVDFAPFNIVNIHDHLYVLYAKQLPPENKDDEAGAGNGFINVFNLDGTFIKRLVTRGKLNSPWGLITAPEDFGKFEHKLLVGNFGDGAINVYNFDGDFLGTLKNKNNETLIIDGLWGLTKTYKADQYVFFASGPNDEANGLVGRIKKIEC